MGRSKICRQPYARERSIISYRFGKHQPKEEKRKQRGLGDGRSRPRPGDSGTDRWVFGRLKPQQQKHKVALRRLPSPPAPSPGAAAEGNGEAGSPPSLARDERVGKGDGGVRWEPA